ncbi:MAG: HAD family hydrolase [Cellulomonadaceae bacterium]|nr:HAD family hydrolase [Cellulomonadaceae bacterium]
MGRKAVFLDVDGTYVNDRGVVPPSAREAVVSARGNGHLVFLCTGRSTAMIWDSVTEVGFDGVIASSGCWVELGGTVLEHRTLPVDDVRRVVEFFDEHDVAFMLESHSGMYGSRDCRARLRRRIFADVTDPTTVAEMEKGLGGFIDRLSEGGDLLRDDISKVSFFDSPLTLDEVRVEFDATFDVIPSMVRRFGDTSGEMAIRGVHKAHGIEVLLPHLGLTPADVIAFGDGFNDIEMLQLAGTGVAMAGAHATVKAAADTETPDPDDDGIALAFARLGLV